MYKEYEKFGGWLLFILITNYISIIFTAISLVLIMISCFFDNNLKSIMQSFILVADSGLCMYFTIKIVSVLRIKADEIPQIIISNMKIIATISLAFLVLEIPMALWINKGSLTRSDSITIRSAISTLFSFLIWKSYFGKSIRVRNYYSTCIDNDKTTE